MKFALVIMLAGFMTSCSTMAVSFTPNSVKEAVVSATAVAEQAVKDQPNGEQLKRYLLLNAEMWRNLADFYGLYEGDK